MNCAVFEQDGERVVLDCGVSFPDGDVPGVDHFAPDFSGLIERAASVAGVIITHGHQDHIGALPLLLESLDVPVYIPRFAAGLLRHALHEAGFAEDEVDIRVVKPGDRVEIGPFYAEFVHVTHSIPDTLAVALTTSVGTLVHTADFKIDTDPFHEPPMDVERFRALGDAGVRALFSDSTNILREGRTRSESMVRQGLERAVREAPGRAIVTMFSTNMYRIQALGEIAQATGRRFLLLGRSLQRNTELARKCGVLSLPSTVFIDEKQAAELPDNQLIIACTGSQAQPRAALARMAFDSLAGFRIEPDDHVIFSARSIPGNEGSIARLHDQIVRRGGVLVQADDVHCSGHAKRDEQKEMLELVRPRTFVPVHGDHRFLVAHADLAAELGVADSYVLENGQTLEIDEDSCRIVRDRPARKVCVDITPFGFLDGDAVKTRRRIAERGLALVTIVVDAETGDLVEAPEVQNIGLFDDAIEGPLVDDAIDAAEDAFYDMAVRDRLDEESCAETVRIAVMRLFRRETGRKPVVIPTVVYA